MTLAITDPTARFEVGSMIGSGDQVKAQKINMSPKASFRDTNNDPLSWRSPMMISSKSRLSRSKNAHC
jgi:hypothetical protein